ncbi:hypothetical protein FN976_01155 [Caenimonas sedimenti]|uniref:Cyclophilin-like domain-containing protein n=1 Tax=Caenimonas sedimenti TaxID=2596921 RepID=A0A562ZW89_9BURK|nr:cyclophilin-like fold protein [Caenimonas sedimenti]TWO72882.1 hypothetical protein FN976_01155 [Caenimonas sedimenti]
MSKLARLAVLTAFLVITGTSMATERIRISSPWGEVTARLDDNPAARSLLRMLPLDIPMDDHLRQEKTSRLPTPLAEHTRTLDFKSGDLGVWGNNAFVIYYTDGTVPSPGIIRIGRVEGSAGIFNRPGPVTVKVERIR